MPSPAQVVEATVTAYNAHDLDAYLALFTPEATFGQLGGRVLLDSRESMRGFYSQFFAARPSVRCESIERAAVGPFVLDRQVVSGEGQPALEAVLLHEVRGGLITCIWYAPFEQTA